MISFWQIAGTHLASECDGGFKTKIDDEKCRAHKEPARGRGEGEGEGQSKGRHDLHVAGSSRHAGLSLYLSLCALSTSLFVTLT